MNGKVAGAVARLTLRCDDQRSRMDIDIIVDAFDKCETERDQLQDALRALIQLIEHDALYAVDPPYDNEPMQLKNARIALQEAEE